MQDPIKSERYPYLGPQPDGKWRETRCKYSPGQWLNIDSSPHVGHTCKVQSLTGVVRRESGNTIGYNVELDSGKWVQVAWDEVERGNVVNSNRPA